MPRTVGRYQLVRPLARGGMAEVFLARRRAGGLEKLLVIKRIRPERANDARFLELFLREARLSMDLTHQNIVPVFDFGKSGDQVFLAMERVEGRDLGSTLAQAADHRPAPLVAAFIAAECCQALVFAHERRDARGEPLGIVHRDVTPRNILVSWSGEVKLTDFGIAALGDDDHHRVIGTPTYLAPEQARGEPVDVRADIYSLGLILRELITGARARPGEDRERLLSAARNGELAPWPVDIDPTLQAIATRATAVDRADRYPTARAMLVELDRYIVSRRAAVTDDAPSSQLATWMRSVWGTAHDDPPTPAAIEDSDELLSFLDDGEPGSQTERSLAATAADDPPDAAPAPPPVAPPPVVAPRATPRRLAWLVALALLVPAAWLAVRATRNTSHTPATAPTDQLSDARSAADTAPVDAPAIDAAAIDATVPDARVADAAGPVDSSRGGGTRAAHIDATVPSVDAGVAPVARTLRVNARPWALVYLDGSSTGFETIASFQVSPGKHRLRFVNPQLQIEREVVVEVPADRDLDHVEDLRP